MTFDNMKKYFTILGTMLLTSSLFAQGAADALMISETQYEGTARSIAMGNAFTALGGDLGGLSVNPASSAVYRCNEFTFSPSFIISGNDAHFNNSYNYDKSTKMAVSNFGFVNTIDTGRSRGLLNFNFGFSINRIKSFNNIVSASGSNSKSSLLGAIASGLNGKDESLLKQTSTYEPYDNPNLSWTDVLAYDAYLVSPRAGSYNTYIGSTQNYLLDGTIGVGGRLQQEYYTKTTGGIHEMTINFGGNYNDHLFLGANLNFDIVDCTISEFYSESAMNSKDFEDGIDRFSTNYWQNTDGVGFNAKFGVIWAPEGGLRLGATYTTPTWYSLTDAWSRNMNSWFDNGNSYSQQSPDGYFEYEVTSPSRYSLGAAYTFGNIGLISFDYETSNYGKIRMADANGNKNAFSDANDVIRKGFSRADVFRAGAEVWFGAAALRGGYNHYGSTGRLLDAAGNTVYNYQASSFFSCGLGLKLNQEGSALLDVAYQKMIGAKREQFSVYNGYDGIQAPMIDSAKSLSKIVMTLALRF